MKVIIDGVEYAPIRSKPATGNDKLDALEVRFSCEAGDDITVREYLCELLRLVWDEQDLFDSKRPWGESGWEFDILIPLARAGFVDLGPIDSETGEPYNWTKEQINRAHAYVMELIAAAFYGTQGSKG